MIKLGQKAPNIILEGFKANHIKKYNLKDYRKKWVILFFYPLDFSFVCPTEIIALNKKYQELIDQLKKTNLDKSAGKSKDVNIESKLRKNIARIKTIIRQKELAKL